MHFPAGDDGDEIFVPLNGDSDLDEAQGGSAVGESKFAGWTEPALRSDRMCWSLIGTAYTLAYELGIFGNYVDGIRSLEGEIKRISGSIGHRQRADRIERLLYIYITQTSGRLGFPSAFPRYVADTDLVNINKNFFTGVSLFSVKVLKKPTKVKVKERPLQILLKRSNKAGLRWPHS